MSKVATKPAAADRAAVRAARYPSQVAEPNAARRAAHMANNTAAGAVVKKAKASAKAEAQAVAPAVVADVELQSSVTERLWQLFIHMGAPGTFTRATALEAALSHGLNPASTSLAFSRWKVQPGTPTAKHLGASKAA